LIQDISPAQPGRGFFVSLIERVFEYVEMFFLKRYGVSTGFSQCALSVVAPLTMFGIRSGAEVNAVQPKIVRGGTPGQRAFLRSHWVNLVF